MLLGCDPGFAGCRASANAIVSTPETTRSLIGEMPRAQGEPARGGARARVRAAWGRGATLDTMLWARRRGNGYKYRPLARSELDAPARRLSPKPGEAACGVSSRPRRQPWLSLFADEQRVRMAAGSRRALRVFPSKDAAAGEGMREASLLGDHICKWRAVRASFQPTRLIVEALRAASFSSRPSFAVCTADLSTLIVSS